MPTWTLNFSCAGLFRPRHWRWSARRRTLPAWAEAPSTSPSAEVSARRAEAMRGLFPKLALWIDRQGHAATMGEAHDYLSQATDLCDLERRIRETERRQGTARWPQ